MTPDTIRGALFPTLEAEQPRFREKIAIATTNWGLFISRSILVDHGGSLEIESTPGQGTSARISLPRG